MLSSAPVLLVYVTAALCCSSAPKTETAIKKCPRTDRQISIEDVTLSLLRDVGSLYYEEPYAGESYTEFSMRIALGETRPHCQIYEKLTLFTVHYCTVRAEGVSFCLERTKQTDVAFRDRKRMEISHFTLPVVTLQAVVHEPYWMLSSSSPHLIELTRLGIQNMTAEIDAVTQPLIGQHPTTPWQLDVLKDTDRLYRQALFSRGKVQCQI